MFTGVVVLEPVYKKKRGANYAEIAGYGLSDAYHITVAPAADGDMEDLGQ